jgi:hypothetical protein
MERIGGEIERELTRTGSKEGIPLAAVTAAWPEVVGEPIARRAWPLRVSRDGTLNVATESATWAHELALLVDEILGRLKDRLGAESPTGVRFAVGPIPEPASAPEPTREPPANPPDVPPEIESEARAAAAAIEDPELQELVAKAARASLVKARSGRHFW